jgi:hypothetical protein
MVLEFQPIALATIGSTDGTFERVLSSIQFWNRLSALASKLDAARKGDCTVCTGAAVGVRR